MVLSDFYILEHAQSVFCQHRCRAVERYQIRGYRVAANPHKTNRQSGSLLSWQPGLKQSYDALFSLPGAHEEDVCLPRPVDVQFVGQDQRKTSPGQERRSKNRGCRWRNTAEGALPSKRSNRFGVREEECRLFPDAREQFIHIVRGGRSAAYRDLEGRINIVQEAVIGVVDELGLLALFHLLDRQPELLSNLVVRMAKQVGDAGVNVHHGRDRTERIFARSFYIIDEGFRQCPLITGPAVDFNVLIVLDLVDPISTGFDRNPSQQ